MVKRVVWWCLCDKVFRNRAAYATSSVAMTQSEPGWGLIRAPSFRARECRSHPPFVRANVYV